MIAILNQLNDLLSEMEGEGRFLNMTLDELSDREVRLSIMGVHLADVVSQATKRSLYGEGYRKFQVAKTWNEEKKWASDNAVKLSVGDLENLSTEKTWEAKQEEIEAQASEKKMQVVYTMLQSTINSVKDRIKVVMAERQMTRTNET